MGLEKAKVLKITPVQAVKATGTYAFTPGGGEDTVSSGKTITIGTVIYEFIFGGTGATGSNIPIASGETGNTGATAYVAWLVSAVTEYTGSLVTAVTGATSINLNIEAKIAGATGNTIKLYNTGTTGAWTASAMAGGIDGTVAQKGAFAVDASYLYFTKDDNTENDQNWYIVTGTLLT